MTVGKPSKANDDRPNLKWVVEWLVEREGQRPDTALLGVNRKTVALALRPGALTGRMNLAVQRLMANLDDPGWERDDASGQVGSEDEAGARSGARAGCAG